MRLERHDYVMTMFDGILILSLASMYSDSRPTLSNQDYTKSGDERAWISWPLKKIWCGFTTVVALEWL